jgi:hypothetical protein
MLSTTALVAFRAKCISKDHADMCCHSPTNRQLPHIIRHCRSYTACLLTSASTFHPRAMQVHV